MTTALATWSRNPPAWQRKFSGARGMQVAAPSFAVTRRRVSSILYKSIQLSLLLALVSTSFLSRHDAALARRDAIVADGQVCEGFQGDDNTYGIGLRLGLYFQWMTTAIANNFVPEEAVTMRGVNNCFQLSTFAGILYITFTRGSTQNAGQLYAVEVWIALLLCMGGVCGGAGAESALDDQHGEPRSTTFANYQTSTIGSIVQFMLYAAIVFYGIWFVYIGIDTMAYTSCSTYAFFFTKVNLFHWFRTFLKVGFTFAAVGSGIAVIVLVGSVIVSFLTNGVLHTLRWVTDFNEEPMSGEMDKEVPLALNNIYFGFGLAFFILSVELTIRWNHIQGVQDIQSTGQILPLMVGGTGFIRVLYKFIVKLIRGDYVISNNYDVGILCCTCSGSSSVTTTHWSSSY